MFHAEPKHLYKKEILSCLCSFFFCFEVFFSFLKSFVYFFSLMTAYLASLVYTLYIEKKIYHSFCKYCFQTNFPVSFVHWSTGFSNFATFYLLLWFQVKGRKSHKVTYATLLSLCRAVSELRTPCGSGWSL